jgi:hypothetical protein
LDTITFEGKDFPARYITLPEFGEVTVATIDLNDKLLTVSRDYVSEEARYIDEKIFFFVEDFEITLPENILAEKVYRDIK